MCANNKGNNKYRHPEAFALMCYKCEKCGTIEVLWNSRDGVTPFIIGCRQCDGEMQHAHWELDRRMPNYEPFDGQRVFVDLTEKVAREHATKQVHRMWDHPTMPMSKRWDTKEEAIEALLPNGLEPGAPHTKVWGEE